MTKFQKIFHFSLNILINYSKKRFSWFPKNCIFEKNIFLFLNLFLKIAISNKLNLFNYHFS